MGEVVLGVDSSTQSCTVEVRDRETGELRAVASAPHPPTHPPVSEQHPEEWWNALVTATRQAIAAAGDVRVSGISIGAQCHGLVALDSRGAVMRPAKLWNDTTSASQAEQLLARRDAAWWARQIGLVPSAAITLTKLLWLRDAEPQTFARIDRLCVPHDWLTLRLTGAHVTDRSDASGTGYFSSDTDSWRTDILSEFVSDRDWSRTLPRVLGPDEPAGAVTPAAAAELGIPAGTVVGAGGGDQHLAAQGIGLREGDVAFSLGTSGVAFTTTQEPVHDLTGAIDGVANVTGGFLPLVCTLNAAKVTDAMARVLGVGHSELSRLALSAPVDPERVVMAAFLDGERSPRLPHARGMLAGLTSEVTREQLALAAFEGVVLGLVRGQSRIAAHGADTASGRVLILGGGARSDAYRQIIADFTHREALTVDAPEATARGAAIQAAAVVEGTSVAAMTRRWEPAITSTTTPRQDRDRGLITRYDLLAEAQSERRY